MPIRAAAVGAEYAPRDLTLSKRDLLSFAAGLGVDWDSVLQDDQPGGVLGFPTYCASLEFNAFGASAAAGLNPVGYSEEEANRGVHAGQDTFFHAPFHPGDRLRTSGRIIAARDSGAGAVLTVRAETRSLLTGEALCTSWISQLFRGLPLQGGPCEVAAPPPQPPEWPDGEVIHRAEVPVSRLAPHVYAECSDIWNPIHSERAVALSAGLKDIILQGTATWGYAAREVLAACGDRDPGRLKRLSTRFAGMVYPGDTLTIEVFAPRDGLTPFSVRNQHGAPILKRGFADVA